MLFLNSGIQRILTKLFVALLIGFTACLALQSPFILKSIARENFHTTSLILTDNSWLDDFDDTSGLSTLQNTQISAGQLLLIDETLPGVATSHSIVPPAGVRTWGRLYFTATIPLSTNLVVDILDATDTPLMHNVPNGGSLAGIDPAVYPALKLQAALTSTVPGQTPTLDEWRITWTPDYPYQIYLPVSGKSFKTQAEPPPPPLGAAVGFTGATSEYLSGKTLYFPSIRKNDDDWNSSFAVQNITGFATTLTVEFFRENGTVAHSMNGIPLRPYGSYMAFADNFPLDNGSYAVRVTATEPLAGMAGTLHASGKMAMAYNGASYGGQQILIPRIYENYYNWTSRLCIHNSMMSNAEVVITGYELRASTPTFSLVKNIYGNGVECIEFKDEQLLPSAVGRAVITTQNTNIVTTVEHMNLSAEMARSYLGLDTLNGSTVLYVPYVQGGFCSVYYIEPSVTTKGITLSYHTADGSYRDLGYIDYQGQEISILLPNTLGSAIVSSEQDKLVALVTNNSENSMISYQPPTLTSTLTYVPNVGGSLEDWDTTLNIQNPNPVTNTITLTFYNQAGDIQLEWEGDLPPYGMGQYQVAALPGLPASFEGSAIISATSPVAVLASKQR